MIRNVILLAVISIACGCVGESEVSPSESIQAHHLEKNKVDKKSHVQDDAENLIAEPKNISLGEDLSSRSIEFSGARRSVEVCDANLGDRRSLVKRNCDQPLKQECQAIRDNLDLYKGAFSWQASLSPVHDDVSVKQPKLKDVEWRPLTEVEKTQLKASIQTLGLDRLDNPRNFFRWPYANFSKIYSDRLKNIDVIDFHAGAKCSENCERRLYRVEISKAGKSNSWYDLKGDLVELRYFYFLEPDLYVDSAVSRSVPSRISDIVRFDDKLLAVNPGVSVANGVLIYSIFPSNIEVAGVTSMHACFLVFE